jgi:uncharacterized protein (TIGR03067 family)
MSKEIEQLQGTWNVVALEIEGNTMAANMFKGAKIIVNGERFTTVSMGSTFGGTLKIDADATPKTLDILYDKGPHAGSASLALYELDGDTWKLCLGFAGYDRPKDFVTSPGSGHALETLKRGQADGETPDLDTRKDTAATEETNQAEAAEVTEGTAALHGEWSMVSLERDGKKFPDFVTKTGKRVVQGNETTITVGGLVIIKATFSVDTAVEPFSIDLTISDGPDKGKKQLGIYELDGGVARFCMSPTGKEERPTEFVTIASDERTLAVWKRSGT